MGVFDKFLNVMRLNPEDEEDDYYLDDEYDDYDDEINDQPKKKLFAKSDREEERSMSDSSNSFAARSAVKTTPKITPISRSKKGTTAGMEVCVFKPTSVEDAREITETLLLNRTVVLNVEGLDIDIAQRIIDFTSGACFAISGNLQKVSNYIFIITPEAVDISGDFQNIIDSFDISGM